MTRIKKMIAASAFALALTMGAGYVASAANAANDACKCADCKCAKCDCKSQCSCKGSCPR